MSIFEWIADRAPPPQWDLRRVGWTLASGANEGAACLVDMRGDSAGFARTVAERRADPARCLFLGVSDGRERARLLAAGGGDALPASVGLAELAQRARRLLEPDAHLPRTRAAGPLVLDLLHRDARAGSRWLALHPREFALLWRLAQWPGQPVSRETLLRDVWRLDFEPGTNRVEVHVSRLRAKLAAAGACGLVETAPRGGYRLAEGRADAPRGSSQAAELRVCAVPISC